MKRWIELCSDMDWISYHGMWARKAKDGSWYVIRWTNMWDACGEEECKRDDQDQYVCELRRLDLKELSQEEFDRALQYSGCDQSDIDPKFRDYAIVESCISYGLGAPIYDESSDKYPLRLRASVRRYAEECMKDVNLLEERLSRPVNAIGSTAAEYGRGDISSALHRGPFDTSKNLMRKLNGIEPVGGVMKRSDIMKCPFKIIVPEHYRQDGSCLCDDAEHRKMMMKEWEYSASDFKDIPLRVS